MFGSIVNVTTFSSLKKLYLQKNVRNGFFMERPGQVSTLEYLDLCDNQMRGPLPDLSLFPSLRDILALINFKGRYHKVLENFHSLESWMSRPKNWMDYQKVRANYRTWKVLMAHIMS
ncbi:hypothetical protein RDI58_017345 [Solanum bulbocastanum]|uniref:Uncharacterized protein n=1 Tax=Solanum bulbocastanum TaxID=147425 RepID=A0AAN8THK4_SOLBU